MRQKLQVDPEQAGAVRKNSDNRNSACAYRERRANDVTFIVALRRAHSPSQSPQAKRFGC
jgi:hypothetical protein